MFGEDRRIRELKRRLSQAGCDMEVVKNWQRQLERMQKQYPCLLYTSPSPRD